MVESEVSTFTAIIPYIAKVIEAVGVFVMIFGGLVAIYFYLKSTSKKIPKAYEDFRRNLGRAILLGLEFLVAGDIIGTIAVDPTFQSLGVLGLIVLIRTFLSLSLEVEIEGHWPWAHKAE